ncbi:hypothetical protein B0T10DRAFT_550675 [Thelonectria olida]|uniref:DUF6594 domain-containing protein n=1 Tax=Thelonectria olida TaxID=1576542 RepID=A0A9P8W241_9HYPO|nr:hypothetical protein B0T10DRAFT_550675 [Thelonectria olida]
MDSDCALDSEAGHQIQDGYPGVAQWISQDRDSETLAFRKFSELSAHNLLYLQSKLLELEEQLLEANKTVSEQHDMAQKDAAREWEVLTAQAAGHHSRPSVVEAAKRGKTLILELREKLEVYPKIRSVDEALLRQSQISALNRPNERVLKAMRMSLKQPYPLLGGKAGGFLDNENDLVALKHPVETDFMSEYLRQRWAPSKETSRDGRGHIGRFKESAITKAVNIITIIVAAIFLIGAIVSFHFARHEALKLCMITLFTIGFAASVGLITNARRVEIFAATAAYAAILVVFPNSDSEGLFNGCIIAYNDAVVVVVAYAATTLIWQLEILRFGAKVI